MNRITEVGVATAFLRQKKKKKKLESSGDNWLNDLELAVDQILQLICSLQCSRLHSWKMAMQFSAVYIILFDAGHQFKRDFHVREKDAKVLSFAYWICQSK